MHGRALDGGLIHVLDAVAVDVVPDEAAQGDGTDEAEVQGHVAIFIGVAVLVVRAVGEELARGFGAGREGDDAAAPHAAALVGGDVGIAVVIVVGIGHLRRGGNVSRRRFHVHHVIAGREIDEVIDAVRARGDRGDGVAVHVLGDGIACGIQQGDGGSLDAGFAHVLQAIGVQVQPHQAAQGDRLEEAKVQGHVAVGVGVAVLVGAAIREDLARGLGSAQQGDRTADEDAGVGFILDIGIGVVVVIGVGILHGAGAEACGRLHLHPIIARRQVTEVVHAVRAGGHGIDGVAVQIGGDGVARTIQQSDGGAFNGRLARILNAIPVHVHPDEAAQGDRLHEAEVHGHVAGIVRVAVLVGGAIRKLFVDGLAADGEGDDARAVFARIGLAGDVGVGVVVVIGVGHLGRRGLHARRRLHLDDIIAFWQIGEVVDAVRSGGDGRDGVAIQVGRDRVARAVQQGDDRAFDGGLAVILDAVGVGVAPHQAAHRNGQGETEVDGEITVGVGIGGVDLLLILVLGLLARAQIDRHAAHACADGGRAVVAAVVIGVVLVIAALAGAAVGVGIEAARAEHVARIPVAGVHLDDVIAGGQAAEVVPAVAVGGGEDGIAIRIGDGIAAGVEQVDQHVRDGRFARILDAVAVLIEPDVIAEAHQDVVLDFAIQGQAAGAKLTGRIVGRIGAGIVRSEAEAAVNGIEAGRVGGGREAIGVGSRRDGVIPHGRRRAQSHAIHMSDADVVQGSVGVEVHPAVEETVSVGCDFDLGGLIGNHGRKEDHAVLVIGPGGRVVVIACGSHVGLTIGLSIDGRAQEVGICACRYQMASPVIGVKRGVGAVGQVAELAIQ